MITNELINFEAEEAVLGTMLVHREIIPELSTWLSENDFYSGDHKAIYGAILRLNTAGIDVNLLTLFDEFIAIGKPELSHKCTGLSALDFHMSPGAAVSFANIVKDYAARRAAIDEMGASVAAIYKRDTPLVEALSKHDTAMMGVKRRGITGTGSTVTNEGLANTILDDLGAACKNKDKPRLNFPWSDVAALTGPLDKGTLVGMMGEPGVGKTVFLENCSEYWLKQGWNVALYHLELSTGMMGKRYIQRQTGISVARQTNGAIGESDWSAVLKAANDITQWPGKLFYQHSPGWSAAQIAAHATQLNELHGINVVIIDYFNKIKMMDRNGLNAALNREQDIEEIKIMLEVNGLVGLMAAQFDKASRKGGGFKTLADAKETSALEDKSNVGIIIKRDRDENGERANETVLSVVKCNAGREGNADVYFVGEKYLFAPATGKVNLNE